VQQWVSLLKVYNPMGADLYSVICKQF